MRPEQTIAETLKSQSAHEKKKHDFELENQLSVVFSYRLTKTSIMKSEIYLE